MQRESGFTLIELISVMLIMAVMAAILVPKFIGFSDNATQRSIDLAIEELNTREELIWHNVKLEGMSDDAAIEAEVYARRDWDIGNGTTVSETLITVRGYAASVNRQPATRIAPAIWSRN